MDFEKYKSKSYAEPYEIIIDDQKPKKDDVIDERRFADYKSLDCCGSCSNASEKKKEEYKVVIEFEDKIYAHKEGSICLKMLVDEKGDKIDDDFIRITFESVSQMSKFLMNHYIKTKRFSKMKFRNEI